MTDGRDNWGKQSGFFALSQHPVLVRVVGTFVGNQSLLSSLIRPATGFTTTHSQKFGSSFWVSVS